MAPLKPVKGNKEHNPWGWVTSVKPDDITIGHLHLVYRVSHFSFCQEIARRNCKRNPYCIFGLGEKKWIQNSDENELNEDDSEFRGEGQYAGLQNLGATCYVNSLLQLWFHNPILRPAILKWTPNLSVAERTNYRPKCAISQLQAMFARMKISKRSKIDPTEFVTSLQLDTSEQQDAQEFSKLFMEVVVNMLTEYEEQHIQNLIRSSFSGQLQNETECLGCHNKTHREETFSELELNVKRALEDSLQELLQDELLDGTEQYFCCCCNKKQDAKRRTILLSLPPVLNLQLMRFVFDRETYRKKKVTTFMQFPETLDMSEYITSTKKNVESQPIYHLNAVLVHNGSSASSGHYVAQIKDIRTGIWHKFNDENVDQVSKKNSKNLVLTDEEPNIKPRGRPKLAEGVHTSNGAYMLVYTLDNYVQNPQPDPDIPSYLFDMVREEDCKYQQEFMVSKAERDLEVANKEKRRSQVELLYGKSLLKQRGNDKEKQIVVNLCSDDEDQPKKSKKGIDRGKLVSDRDDGSPNRSRRPLDITRCEDEDLKERKSKKARSNEGGEVSSSSSNNTSESGGSCPNIDNDEEVAETKENIDFVSVDWLQKWLDPEVAVIPSCNNDCLKCKHGKLAPPKPNWNAVPYRIVPSSFGEEIFKSYGISPRFSGHDSYCESCVREEYHRLRSLTELEEDNKLCQDLIKKSDIFNNQFLKAHGSYSKEYLAEKLWIGKESLRKWKRVAKSSIDGTDSSVESQEICDDNSNSDSMAGVFNSEIVCDHGNLLPDPNIRKLITLRTWTILDKYFKDAKVVRAANSQECKDCINEMQQHSKVAQQFKEQASTQKSALIDLFSNRNRPVTDKKGEFYIVPLVFVESWRKFIRDPTKGAANIKIVNKDLLCTHDKFIYSLTFSDHEYENNNMDSYEDYVSLLTEVEWNFLKNIFSYDVVVKVVVDESKDLTYDPELCVDCATEWWMRLMKKVFTYENAPLYVCRRDKNEDPVLDNDPVDEDDYQLPAKRERREKEKYDPTQNALQLSAQAIRRSQRPRRQRGEKTYKVSSDTTIKELKCLILNDFKAIPSDQHLFHQGVELVNSAWTLRDSQIPSGATIYLEIDTVCNNNAEPMEISPETGFRGTLLLGSNRDSNTTVSLQQPSSPQIASSTT